jgi:hypothetical protein
MSGRNSRRHTVLCERSRQFVFVHFSRLNDLPKVSRPTYSVAAVNIRQKTVDRVKTPWLYRMEFSCLVLIRGPRINTLIGRMPTRWPIIMCTDILKLVRLCRHQPAVVLTTVGCQFISWWPNKHIGLHIHRGDSHGLFIGVKLWTLNCIIHNNYTIIMYSDLVHTSTPRPFPRIASVI